MLKNGHLSDEEIALYADASLAGNMNKVDVEIRTHILHCDECADKVLAVTEITEDFLNDDANSPVKRINFKKRAFIQFAASIIIILGVGFMFHQLKLATNNGVKPSAELTDRSKETDSLDVMNQEFITASPKDSTPPDTHTSESQNIHKNSLALAEHKDLEKLVERFNQGVLRGSRSVLSESTTELVKGDFLELSWNNEEQESLIIEFFNNTGEKLFEIETSESSIKTDRLAYQGLYYWKLLNEDFDLLFCGKIIVK